MLINHYYHIKDQCGIFQDIYHISYFLQKGKLVLRSLLSEGRYFGGDGNFRDLLTPVTFYHYFRRFATFEGSLLLELYDSLLTPTRQEP